MSIVTVDDSVAVRMIVLGSPKARVHSELNVPRCGPGTLAVIAI
jgi:hypothetical protein